ncbi:nitroreductase [Chitinophaga silvatica]|uniref:Putative NAD(P)H nitroreductase n=1 Tax=Chitinophaga silvatica TaxID=2282649 RepID=A0A3E1Y8C9_9BACT|nr:nitroreductase [Chitinophaga silvatica]RFS21441.1 nitroreductase [Chitinophaga silvatica]
MDNTAIDQVIISRRTVKPTSMNGQKIDNTTVESLLQLADWAPTHGYTEPWYFVVFSDDKVKEFCNDHAQMYKDNTPADKYINGNYDKLKHQGDLASHVIAVCMKRGNNPKIPAQEELAAVSCAVENILLGATARGIASYWGSGGMTYHPAMHEYFGLGEDDLFLGFVYLGYTSEPLPAGRRIKSPAEKFKWM